MIDAPPVPLSLLLDHLDSALGPEITHGAWLLRVEGAGDEITIGLLELDTERSHPIDALLGLRAEPSWTAVGVVVHGQARSVATDADSAAGDRASARVRIVYGLTADGYDSSVLHYLDGSGRVEKPGSPEGRLSDCCRRIMGLPTAPAPIPPIHWFTTVWLSSILSHQAYDPRNTCDWASIVALHPLLARSQPATPDQLASRVGRTLAGVGWAELRAEACPTGAPTGILGQVSRRIGADVLAEIPPHIAAWTDEGMFARCLIAGFPDPVDMLIDLAGLLPPGTFEALLTVVTAWELW